MMGKKNSDKTIDIYWVQNWIESTKAAGEQSHNQRDYSWEMLQYNANHTIGEIVGMGEALDSAQRNSFLDSISGLPNLRAALLKMDKTMNDAMMFSLSFSILLTDGDNLRRHNSFRPVPGDEATQKSGNRPNSQSPPRRFRSPLAHWG